MPEQPQPPISPTSLSSHSSLSELYNIDLTPEEAADLCENDPITQQTSRPHVDRPSPASALETQVPNRQRDIPHYETSEPQSRAAGKRSFSSPKDIPSSHSLAKKRHLSPEEASNFCETDSTLPSSVDPSTASVSEPQPPRRRGHLSRACVLKTQPPARKRRIRGKAASPPPVKQGKDMAAKEDVSVPRQRTRMTTSKRNPRGQFAKRR
ncbi:MAG: hypothetical protein L6R40_004710 [Gallowayella cf. fulva]|nr:MAG: hypothetical protein L6R40_004710 [Xanthomendoza cf. fulva]